MVFEAQSNNQGVLSPFQGLLKQSPFDFNQMTSGLNPTTTVAPLSPNVLPGTPGGVVSGNLDPNIPPSTLPVTGGQPTVPEPQPTVPGVINPRGTIPGRSNTGGIGNSILEEFQDLFNVPANTPQGFFKGKGKQQPPGTANFKPGTGLFSFKR